MTTASRLCGYAMNIPSSAQIGVSPTHAPLRSQMHHQWLHATNINVAAELAFVLIYIATVHKQQVSRS
jgi:hypothetical protein